uniref:KIF-binding protein n=1 Tax=Cyclophora tenuis TaxID=216820 RepID=A0A7S1D894_CYCTE|mmetsp:Transcript_383/g.667  ORF Transcript_383/g.667 Transcript_383/m.667 type:complete len:206 (+) Transcript_383:32-649(+)
MHWFHSMITNYYLDCLEVAVLRGEKAWAMKDIEGANTYSCMQFFFSALTALEAYRTNTITKTTTKKRKYRLVFRKYSQLVEKWFQRGSQNSEHLSLLLDAETMVWQKKSTVDVKVAFDISIVTASRGGFQQDAALANERAGVFFLHKNYPDWAFAYLTEARELYKSWGALAKVRQMDHKYSLILAPNNNDDNHHHNKNILEERAR